MKNKISSHYKKVIYNIAKIYNKYKKIAILLLCLWVLTLIVIAPIMFIYGGWPLLLAYLMCKFTGVCPI